MPIKHEALIDLEESLYDKFRRSWAVVWKSISFEVQQAVDQKEWDKAHKLIDTLITEDLLKKNLKLVETIGMSSVLLGTSRIVDPRKSMMRKNPPLYELGNMTAQFALIIGRNMVLALRKQAHTYLYDMELAGAVNQSTLIFKDSVKKEFLVNIDNQGKSYLSLAANLHVSRLASFGFLSEAYEQGFSTYMVSEVLDDRTCPVCQQMHGTIFPVEAGVAQAMSIMQADDPDSLKSIAPWFARSKENIEFLSRASAEDLIDEGLQMPPYHPGCRGILVESDEQIDSSPNDRTTMASALVYSVLPSDVLGRRAVGDTSDLDGQQDKLVEISTQYGLIDNANRIQEESARRDQNNLTGFGLGVLLGGILASRNPASPLPSSLDEQYEDTLGDEVDDEDAQDIIRNLGR